MDEVVECRPAPPSDGITPSTVPNTPAAATEEAAELAALAASYAALEEESHVLQQSFVQQNHEGKSTGGIYKRHYENYQLWYGTHETKKAEQDSSYKPIPALPITAAKVAFFLEYEMTRPQKRKHSEGEQSESTSTCGIQHAKQVISALEHFRFNDQHKYLETPGSQKALRDDNHIKVLEGAFAHNEPERIKKSHALKAAGTRADTYDDSQLTQLATSGLDAKGATHIWRAQRDRAMLLTSSSTAFRGDSSRSLLWSDLYSYDVPMNAKGLGEKVRALALIADQSKINQSGRVDEHGAFRHRITELCPVGGIGFFFFTHFHVINAPLPGFSVDFSDAKYGEYGKREWYQLFLFSTSKDCMKEMQYATHRDRVKGLYEKNNIAITKVTHAGRGFTAKTAREHGASSTEVKALGNWSDTGSYRACYDRAFPVRGMLAAAMFDSEHPESHFLARDALQPPPTVTAHIFPWIEDQLSALNEREAANIKARDISLRHFLTLLVWLRTVIVQDAAVLFINYPLSPIFGYPPFTTPEFRNFAGQSTAIIAKAERDVALALEKLPKTIANTFTAAMSRIAMDQELERRLNKAYQEETMTQLVLLKETLADTAAGGSKKRRKLGHTVSPPPPPQVNPPIPIPRSIVYPSPVSTPPSLPELADFPNDSTLADFVDTLPGPSTHSVEPQFSPEQLAALEYIRASGISTNNQSSPSTALPSTGSAVSTSASGPLPSLPSPSVVTTSSSIAAAPVAPTGPAISTSPFPSLPSPSTHVVVTSPSALATSVTVAPALALPSGASLVSEAQRTAWLAMVKKYCPPNRDDTRLRRHQWEWHPTQNKYIPYYEYQRISKITDIWTEHTKGLNGFLSVRELDDGWAAAWRRNQRGHKSEQSRRRKVISLIDALMKKRHWTEQQALSFIQDRYEQGRDSRFPTARKFIEFLQKTPKENTKSGEENIILESKSYTA